VLYAVRDHKGDIDTTKDPEIDAVDALTSANEGGVVVDIVGQPALEKATVAILGRGGRLVFISAARSGPTQLRIEMMNFYRKEKVLTACNSLSHSAEESAGFLKALTSSFELSSGAVKAFREGEWTTVKLEDGVEAYVKARQGSAEKSVVME
jgi:NADPH:quinone reductase-like Zn-dependent oxidoreductase